MANAGPATKRKLWFGEFDLSGDMNAMRLASSVERKDNTVFGNDTRRGLGGLNTVLMQHEGLWQAGAGLVDPTLSTKLAVADIAIGIGVETGADGEVGYLFRALEGEYTPISGGEVGEMHRFSVSGEGSGGDPAVRSTIMHNATKTASGNSTARQLGAVSNTQKVYATLHVITASAGDTLDVTVESDTAVGFPTPSTRLTFPQATAVTSGYQTQTGSITDDWWRVAFTIGGVSPSFEFIVLVGIL